MIFKTVFNNIFKHYFSQNVNFTNSIVNIKKKNIFSRKALILCYFLKLKQ